MLFAKHTGVRRKLRGDDDGYKGRRTVLSRTTDGSPLTAREPPPRPKRIAGRGGKACSASVFGRAFAVRVSLRHVPTHDVAESYAETPFLRLVEALVQRLLGVGQAPQCRRPGGQCIRTIAQALDRIGTLPGSASCLALGDPLVPGLKKASRSRPAVSPNSFPIRPSYRTVNSGSFSNPIVFGACTNKITITHPDYDGWLAVAPAGDLSPASRTSGIWDRQWPIRPDVVFEGGNFAHDGVNPASAIDDLQLVSTHYRPNVRLFDAFGDKRPRWAATSARAS
jgi:hypothetical protein